VVQAWELGAVRRADTLRLGADSVVDGRLLEQAAAAVAGEGVTALRARFAAQRGVVGCEVRSRRVGPDLLEVTVSRPNALMVLRVTVRGRRVVGAVYHDGLRRTTLERIGG
jgi:hypothetical protein